MTTSLRIPSPLRAAFKTHDLLLESALGRGGSGEVFGARHARTGEALAVKLCRAAPSTPAEAAFRREFECHSRLQHPNILPVCDLARLDGHGWYYRMQWIETTPLPSVHARGGTRALAEVVLSVSSALEHAHAQGIIHGDLKPGNILVALSRDGRVAGTWLTDFGDARRPGDLDGDVSGTPAYWSPEQLLGLPADGRSDLWSLGVTIHETLAGRPPFGESDMREILTNLNAPPPPLRPACPGVDPRWADLVDLLLQPDRTQRPSSARHVMRLVAPLAGMTEAPAEVPVPPGPALDPVGLEDVLAEARSDDRAGRTTLVLGGTGVGKTRFLRELARLAQRDGKRVLWSDAREAGPIPLSLFRRVRQAGVSLDLVRDLPSGPETGSDAGVARRESRLGALVEAVLGEPGSAVREGVLLFDSVDRADDDSIDVLERLADRIRGTPARLFLAVDSAKESLIERLQPRCAAPVRLRPFAEGRLPGLIAANLGSGTTAPLDHDESEALARWLLRETGGVPASVEAALSHLFDMQVLRRDGAAWTLDARRLSAVRLATDAKEEAAAIRSRFRNADRDLLDFVAVLGPEFDASLLSLVGSSGADPADFMARCRREHILGETPEGAPRFRFLRPGVWRALYARVPASLRRAAHARIAAALDARSDGTRAGEVAHHLDRSGDAAGAAKVLSAAAARSAGSGAPAEAVRLWREAFSLRPAAPRAGLPPFAVPWLRCLLTLGRYREGVDVAQELLAGSPRLGRTASADRIGVEVLRARCLNLSTRSAEARDALRPLVRLRGLERHPELATLAWRELGQCELHLGDLGEARRALDRSRDLGIEHGLPVEVGLTEIRLGVHAWRAGDLHAALDWHRSAERSFIRASARDLVPTASGNQAVCHWYLLETELAVTLHRRAAEGYLLRHRHAEASRSFQNLAHVLTELGQWPEAEHALQRADDLCRAQRSPRQASYFEYGKARLALHRGRLEEATRRIDAACRLARESADARVTVGHDCLKGLIDLDAGRIDDAIAIATKALETSEQHGDDWGIAKCLYLIGAARHGQGRNEEALPALDRAARVAAERVQPVASFRAELARASVRAALGDAPGARESLAAATALQVRSGSRFWEGLVRRTAAEVRLAEDRPEDAREELARAYEIFAALRAERWRGDTLFAQARVWATLGQIQAARSADEVARALYRSLGLTPPPPLPGISGAQVRADSSNRLLADAASILRQFFSPGRLDALLNRVLDTANSHLGTERGVIALFEPGTGRLQPRATRALDERSLVDAMEISWSTVDAVGSSGEPVISNDALEDARLGSRESVRMLRIRSLAAIPLRAHGQTVGAMYVDHRSLPGLFGPDAIEVLRFLAEVAATSVRTAQRLEIEERARRELRAELEGDDLRLPDAVEDMTVVGRGARVRSQFRRGMKAAKSGRTILLTGPSGCGKDHFARVLHHASGLTGRFVVCPMPAIMDSLFPAEFFGVAHGSATGVDGRNGLVDRAQGGTLFLNEIGDLSPNLQAVLLEFLDHGTYRHVGSAQELTFTGLIICATNRNLAEKQAEGTFRSDLYYRIAKCAVDLPPLDDRIEDLPEFAALFLRKYAESLGRVEFYLSADAVDELTRRSWPGNLRQLKSVVENAADAAGADRLIVPEHLGLPAPSGTGKEKDWNLRRRLDEAEIEQITAAMRACHGVIVHAARLLGIAEAVLRYKIAKHRLQHLVVKPRR